MVWTLAAFSLPCSAGPLAIHARWQVAFPSAAAHGKAVESTAVPTDGGSLMVTVVPPGADAAHPKLFLGGREVAIEVVGTDPVSRLGFFKVTGSPAPKPEQWVDKVNARMGTVFQAVGPGGIDKCRSAGWVKQVDEKVLPLALLRVNFVRAVPPPGTPLLDASGRVSALVFQSARPGNTGYAIPAEAVQRVRRDVCNGGKLIHGWLGITLNTQNRKPQIVSVLAGSPASTAGIKPADMLVSVGTRTTSDYEDAVNAFFYLIPGEPVRVKLLRGTTPLEFTLTPVKPRAK